MEYRNAIPKHELVELRGVGSLIKAEWTVIRTYQNLVLPEWSSRGLRVFPDTCCGILFLNNFAYAGNGHWVMKVKVDGPSIDPNVYCFFYSFLDDDVYENFNPFLRDAGITIEEMRSPFEPWCPHHIKIKPVDIRDFVEQIVPAIRDRRNYAFQAGYDPDMEKLRIRLKSRRETTQDFFLPVYKPVDFNGFPPISVNLSYLYKIMEIVSSYYNVVELCSYGGMYDTMVIKAKNPTRNKPDMRFALGSFQI